ncbi:phasin family protein [Fluoribacter dumoffii]|uniref:Phasin protein n=1 Tax=Fluoribacter dumoffii TaxID=463 RepID=A0A377G678_9GAMM|nr:phasin family protein [Fluoribacter dumoffii]KTC92463.1 Phasin protein [Fluoribacter dumoffii NY 23]MCW8387039.1 phasin family protein [Fluoribacter dumoffii]MCW8417457.1 phasin family protein [Fluoribacter dumoffii]MCW8454701.1 phasin family protein [Fluoribacter dumoffii]MCW8461221.1 phasin family protein [Fluoribacter dumoffii]
MTQQNFERWTEMAKKFQEPFQAMAELNVKTLQSMNYLKPEEISSIKKPEELLEKQINLAVENGHKTLDYMQKSFQIIEKAMLGFVQEAKKASELKH